MESLVKDVPRKVFLVVDKHKTVGDKAAKGLRRRTGRRDSGSRHEFRRIDVPPSELRQSHKYLELIPGQSRPLRPHILNQPVHNSEYGSTATGRRRSMFVGRTAFFRKPESLNGCPL